VNFIKDLLHLQNQFTYTISIMFYTVIKSKKQYIDYCNRLEVLGDKSRLSKIEREEMELLQLLIDKYDELKITGSSVPPHETLKSLMLERNMKGIELAALLHVSTGLVSDMLAGKKAISKSSIQVLSAYFKVHPNVFF